MDAFDRDLETSLRGQLAGGTLSLIEDVLGVLDRRVDDRVFAMLHTGRGLTPEQASQAWYEKYALRALRERLRNLATAGQSAGRRITPTMELKSAP